MKWPNDPDGDVLRRLQAEGFDFSREHTIDFNIDFNSWPLSPEATAAVTEAYQSCEIVQPDEEDTRNGKDTGYVQFQIVAKLTYELVIGVQEEATEKAKPFDGWCEPWGVWQG